MEKNKVLIVIDMQNDFVYGPLGTPEARAIVPNVMNKIADYKRNNWPILYTRDTHHEDYLDTQEGKKLPVPHCIHDTEGWQIIPEIIPDENGFIFYKNTFGKYDWELETWLDCKYARYDIEIIGVDTDVCVVSNALILKATFPENEITVDASCCAGSTPERHKAALEVMKSCQINVIGEGDLIK